MSSSMSVSAGTQNSIPELSQAALQKRAAKTEDTKQAKLLSSLKQMEQKTQDTEESQDAQQTKQTENAEGETVGRFLNAFA